MPKQGETIAQANRAIRQENLRALLSEQGHLQHVIEICDELNTLTNTLEIADVARKKIVIDTKMKLINKYLPDLKNVEIANDGGGELVIKVVEFSEQYNSGEYNEENN